MLYRLTSHTDMFLLPLHRLNRPKIPRGRGLGQIPNTQSKRGEGQTPTIQIEQAGDTEGGGGQTPTIQTEQAGDTGGQTSTIQTKQAGDTEWGGGGQTDMFLIFLLRPNELKIPGAGLGGDS